MEKSKEEILQALTQTGLCIFSNEPEGSSRTKVDITLYLRLLDSDPVRAQLTEDGYSFQKAEPCFVLSAEEKGLAAFWQNKNAMASYFNRRKEKLKEALGVIFVQEDELKPEYFLLKYKVLLRTGDIDRISGIARSLYYNSKDEAVSA